MKEKREITLSTSVQKYAIIRSWLQQLTLLPFYMHYERTYLSSQISHAFKRGLAYLSSIIAEVNASLDLTRPSYCIQSGYNQPGGSYVRVEHGFISLSL